MRGVGPRSVVALELGNEPELDHSFGWYRGPNGQEVTGRPADYDFDMFEEMTINTGGVDATQQTGGVGINLVTKSGGDRFRGSSRFLS